ARRAKHPAWRQAEPAKINLLPKNRNYDLTKSARLDMRDGWPFVTRREAGCGGRGRVARRAARARTVKPCGPVPPMQGTSPGSKARGDGGKKAGSPGRSRSSRKPLRRECRVISAYLCWPRVRLFLFARKAVGASCTRHS